jgi:hypothetical protein
LCGLWLILICFERRVLSGTAIRVPLITRRGNSLKHKKRKTRINSHEPKTRARRDHDPGGPRGPSGWHDGCPLGRGPPRSRAKRSLGRGPPRSRAKRPLERGPPRSRAQRPLGEDRLTRGHLHVRRPRSCPCVRVFNALSLQDARHDPDTPGNHAPALFHRLPGKAIPATV